jgi:MoaA/NifB/PqqE/SkfB family radical SAM enzyme
MSEVKDKLSKVKQDLASISPTMCIAKWKQVTLHLHNGRTHSCHHPYPHGISAKEIQSNPSALHNTSEKKEARKEMLKGKRPKECQYCWNVEDLELFSKGEIFSDRITKSSEHWAHHHLDDIRKLDHKQNVNPSYVEVSFSNLCNFKCSYCSPVYSSKWQEEIETHGPYNTSNKLNNLDYFKRIGEMPLSNKLPNPYVEAFWKWWPDLINSLEVFRITGGEPLLNDNTFKVLDYLAEHPQPNLKLGVNTNGNAPQKLMDSFIEKVRHLVAEKKISAFTAFISLDGYGPYAEYGRHGLNYETWVTNVNKILSEIPGSNIVIMCTTNIFSVPEFKKFVEMTYDLKAKYSRRRINVDINILRFPHHQNLTILTESFKTSFDDTLAYMKANEAKTGAEIEAPGFSVHEINSLERLIEYVKNGPHPKEKIALTYARADFYKFVTEHDRRRGTKFLETFPQLQSFYDICKMLS